MFEFPKLVVMILVFGRGVDRLSLAERPGARGAASAPGARPRQAIQAEDLVACGVCGAYVAAQAPGCGRPDCPRPR